MKVTFRQKAIFIGLLLVLTGALWYYFQGYKDNDLINNLSAALNITGWLIILFSVAGEFLLKNKVKFKKNKSKWFSQTISKTLIFLLFCGLLLGNEMLVDSLKDNRISNILNNQPTKNTIATVIEIENRNFRGGSKSYAIINYSVDNKIIVQSIFNYCNQYSVGQTYELQYSIDYPEMFRLVK